MGSIRKRDFISGYRFRPRHRRFSSRRPDLRLNPINKKALNKKLAILVNLGISKEIARNLVQDLLGEFVDPGQAVYVLDWWTARLSLIRFVETDDPKLQSRYLDFLQRYLRKYKISPYDLSLDDELRMEYDVQLRHFVHLAGPNPYFRNKWPILHRIQFEATDWNDRKETHEWLGQVVKWEMPLSKRRDGYPEGVPAIKILRGSYIGDPIQAEEVTEIPKEAVISIEETYKPSDMIEFLTEAEDSISTARFFVPESHDPFITFEDGKSWVVVAPEDQDAEGTSLGDCGTGQYHNDSIIIISLREQVSPEFFQAHLKAEVVFPNDVPRDATFEEIKDSIGVLNQLRGYKNSKPTNKFHPYIVALLEQPWLAQIVRPSHKPEGKI